MIQKILVPTDFSDTAEPAENLAIDLGKRFGSKVCFYHSIYLPKRWEELGTEGQLNYPQSYLKFKEMEENFANLKAKCQDHRVVAQSIYANGGFINSFANSEELGDFDLMVMGSKGASGIKEFLWGSNTQKVIRKSQLPTLVLKENVKPSFRNILFASDFQMESMPAFEQLIKFGRCFGSTIHLVYILNNDQHKLGEDDLARMKVFEKTCWQLPVVLHAGGGASIERGITFFQENIQPDLLAITHTGGNLMKNMRRGSISEALINHLSAPLLILHSIKQKAQGRVISYKLTEV